MLVVDRCDLPYDMGRVGWRLTALSMPTLFMGGILICRSCTGQIPIRAHELLSNGVGGLEPGIGVVRSFPFPVDLNLKSEATVRRPNSKPWATAERAKSLIPEKPQK